MTAVSKRHELITVTALPFYSTQTIKETQPTSGVVSVETNEAWQSHGTEVQLWLEHGHLTCQDLKDSRRRTTCAYHSRKSMLVTEASCAKVQRWQCARGRGAWIEHGRVCGQRSRQMKSNPCLWADYVVPVHHGKEFRFYSTYFTMLFTEEHGKRSQTRRLQLTEHGGYLSRGKRSRGQPRLHKTLSYTCARSLSSNPIGVVLPTHNPST